MPVFKQFVVFFIVLFNVLYSTSVFAQEQDNQAKYQSTINDLMVGNAQVFRKNAGQWDGDILYQTSGDQALASFYKDKVAFTLRNNLRSESGQGYDPMTAKASFLTWNLVFDNADQSTILPTGNISRNINYFGPASPKGAKLLEYQQLDYQNIYSNIDLTFYSAETGALKYDYIIKPGGSIHDIQMYYEGVDGIKVLKDGKLMLNTPWGDFTEDKPYSYQIIEGKTVEVEVQYSICDNRVGFEIIGTYNPKYELVIDPIYLDWSTFFYGEKAAGGTYNWTWILDIDIDDEDYVYITGMTSEAYPGTVGAYDTSITGYYDAFICKIKPKGDSIEYFSYLGGTTYDYGMNLTVNSNRQPVISGLTWGGGFPTTVDAYDTIGRGGSGYYYQGFVTKFSEKGDSLIFSTYLSGKSGTGFDWIRGMTLNSSGDVYLVGNTQSSTFPTTAGCFQSTFGGEDAVTVGGNYYTRGDAFMTCLKSDGTGLIFSTFIGGSKNESAYDIYLDENEEIYVVGTTSSGNFPLTPGAGIFNSYIKGTYDAFVMKFKSSGNQMIFSKIMGGTGDDVFEGIYSNHRGEPFIAGYSNSTNFPTTKNALQKANAGGYDFVIVKMISAGTNVRWSTYLGGSGNEYYYNSPFFSTIKITANVKEEAIISGISQSSNFPVTSDALQPTNKSTYYYKQNLTITKLSYNGDKILYATYFGGSYWEWPGSVKTKRVGCVSYILSAGITASSDYPTTKGVYKDSIRHTGSGSYYSGFVSKFRDTLYTEPINLGFADTLVECDNVFEILDAQNRGADFLWDHGWTEQVRIVVDSGTFWVRATYGCDTVRDTITIELEHSPKVPVFGNDTTYCDNFPILVLDAKNDTIYRSYRWSTGDTTQKIIIDKKGEYYVDVSTPHCGTKTDTINFKLLKTPDVDLGKNQIECDSVNVLLDAKNTNNEVIYLWSTKDSMQTITAKDTGVYSVRVSNFCGVDSTSIVLNKFVQPKAVLPKDSVFCDAVFIILSGGQGENGEEYQWTSLDGTTEYANSSAYLLKQPQNVRLIVKNKCGNSSDSIYISRIFTPKSGVKDTIWACDDIDRDIKIGRANNSEKYQWNVGLTTESIKVQSPGFYKGIVSNACGSDSSTWQVELAFTPQVTLPNDSTYCGSVDVVLDVKNQDPEMLYQWQDGSKSSAFTAKNAGKFWVKIENRCGSSTDTVKYKLLQKPGISLGTDLVFCGGIKPFDLNAGTANNEERYLWSDGNTSNKMLVSSEGDHWVSIENYCGKASDTINVRISPNPVVKLGSDTILCGNFNLKLDAGNPGMRFNWSPFGETTQTITATEQTIYSVVVTNADGCKGKSSFEIGSGCVSHVFIPSSFTPNSDGLNDVFKPTIKNVEAFTMSIYNRWGEMLFETQDIEKGWDGSFQDKLVPAGIYLYSIRLITTEDARYQNLSGIVHIIR